MDGGVIGMEIVGSGQQHLGRVARVKLWRLCWL